MAEMKRGENVALTREIPSLTGLVLGISWDAGGEQALADALVFGAVLCGANRRVRPDQRDRDFVFFNQLTSVERSVAERDETLGDDGEQIEIDLPTVPADVERIVAVLYVNAGPVHRRTLGQLHSCVIRVLDRDDDRELVRSEDLAPAFDTQTAVTLGEVYRHEGGWKFRVLGQAYAKGFAGIADDFGIPQ